MTRSICALVRTIDQVCSIASASSNWTRQARATEWTVSPVESETRWRWKRVNIFGHSACPQAAVHDRRPLVQNHELLPMSTISPSERPIASLPIVRRENHIRRRECSERFVPRTPISPGCAGFDQAAAEASSLVFPPLTLTLPSCRRNSAAWAPELWDKTRLTGNPHDPQRSNFLLF